jgi:nucleotide-binding universal stress UspA family protein
VIRRPRLKEKSMKYMVAYNGSSSSERALALAARQAQINGALIYVVTSMEGGSTETLEEIRKAEDQLREAREMLAKHRIECETMQLARGLTPGEDIIKFAQDNGVDHIYIGIEKKSRTRKLLMGSTAQFIILKSPCPVTTTK